MVLLELSESPERLLPNDENAEAVCLNVKERIGWTTDSDGKKVPIYQGRVLIYRRDNDWKRP